MNLDFINEQVVNNYEIEVKNIIKNEDSSQGNVFDIESVNGKKYILKIYDENIHAENMTNLHEFLIKNNVNVPQIIANKNNNFITNIENKFFVIYEFIDGKQVSNCGNLTEQNIKNIAEAVRKIHDTTSGIKFNFNEVDFANKLDRKSVLHFDLTKDNIFIDNDKVKFIDFDDAKYGDSACDVAILISFLFISKKRGINNEAIKIFLEGYYKNDEKNKKIEVPILKEYAKKWLKYLMDGNEFETSLKESFEYKKNMWENML